VVIERRPNGSSFPDGTRGFAQQVGPTKPRELSRARLPALMQSPATQGFVMAATVGIPRWQASSQKIEVEVSQE
jgi:hypothetical protein